MSQQTTPGTITTTAQLRGAIDSGETGDKLPASDPAASPLGTDDEAAGRPASPARVAQAARQETHAGLSDSEAPPALRSPWLPPVALIGVIVLIAAVVIGFYLTRA